MKNISESINESLNEAKVKAIKKPSLKDINSAPIGSEFNTSYIEWDDDDIAYNYVKRDNDKWLHVDKGTQLSDLELFNRWQSSQYDYELVPKKAKAAKPRKKKDPWAANKKQSYQSYGNRKDF